MYMCFWALVSEIEQYPMGEASHITAIPLTSLHYYNIYNPTTVLLLGLVRSIIEHRDCGFYEGHEVMCYLVLFFILKCL